MLQSVCGKNALSYILTGKTVWQINLAHILTESALMIRLQQFALARDCFKEWNIWSWKSFPWNDKISSKTDLINNIFYNTFALWLLTMYCIGFLLFVRSKKLKLNLFLSIWKNDYINKNIYTIKPDSIHQRIS